MKRKDACDSVLQNELEEKMLMNLHKSKWSQGLSLAQLEILAKSNHGMMNWASTIMLTICMLN